MINRFFTIEHEKSVLDVLELRAAQLTLNFLSSSCDEDIKSSVREHYLNKIDASLPLTTDQVLLDPVLFMRALKVTHFRQLDGNHPIFNSSWQ
ncbi:MAG: hypothetical protein Q4G44_10925 [Alcaligenaceae bacterium]|nr:hypothetical protein [Alcaligenaceae bacterium]